MQARPWARELPNKSHIGGLLQLSNFAEEVAAGSHLSEALQACNEGSPLGPDKRIAATIQTLAARVTPPAACCPKGDFNVCQHGSDFTAPIKDVVARLESQGGVPLVDGFCHFGWDVICTRARRQSSYLEFAIPTSAVVSAAAATMGSYQDPSGWQTMPNVYASDAKYCNDIGALDLPDPDALLGNFSALHIVASGLCAKLRSSGVRGMNMAEYQSSWSSSVASFEADMDLSVDARQHSANYSSQKYQELALGTCDLGGLGCNLAYCFYNFCRLPGNKVGMGKQCRSNWLTEQLPPLSKYD